MIAIGAHSVKKGACTFLNGVLEGPNAHAVELRADHSIGDVRKCYIFRSVAQDQYCGRLLAMRNTDSQDFFADLPKLDQCALSWETLLPAHSRVPDNFKPLLPHLLAALVQHSDWLRETLPAGHPSVRPSPPFGRYRGGTGVRGNCGGRREPQSCAAIAGAMRLVHTALRTERRRTTHASA